MKKQLMLQIPRNFLCFYEWRLTAPQKHVHRKGTLFLSKHFHYPCTKRNADYIFLRFLTGKCVRLLFGKCHTGSASSLNLWSPSCNGSQAKISLLTKWGSRGRAGCCTQKRRQCDGSAAAAAWDEENLQRNYPVTAQSPIAAASGQRLRSGPGGRIDVSVQRSRCGNLILLFLSRLYDNKMGMKFDL